MYWKFAEILHFFVGPNNNSLVRDIYEGKGDDIYMFLGIAYTNTMKAPPPLNCNNINNSMEILI